MTRESRMLVVLGALSLGGVIALMAMANRYAKMFEEREARKQRPVAGQVWKGRASSSAREASGSEETSGAPIEEALRRVDAFVEVRRTLLAEIDGGVVATPGGETRLHEVRDAAAERVGLAKADYATVRARYRDWKLAGRGPRQDALSTAFELRRANLEAVDLGEHEPLDR